MKEIGESRFGTEVLQNERLTLVDFWADWCGPCKALAPVLDEVAAQLGDRVDFVKFNVDDNLGVPSRYGVRGIPALLLFKNGTPVDRRIGLQTASQLTEFLLAHLDPAQANALHKALPMNAFGGDEGLKHDCLARLEASMAANEVRATGHTFWDGKSGSPLGCATRQPDMAGAASLLGIPSELVALVDQIENFTDGSSSAAGKFTARWLTAIPPGSDTSAWPTALLSQILRSEQVTNLASGDPGLLALRHRMAELAEAHVDQGEARTRAWSEVSEACIGHPAFAPARRGGSLATLFNQLAWEFSDGQAAPGTMVSGLAMVLFDSTKQRFDWTSENQTALDTLGRQTAERAKGQGATPNVWALMEQENAGLTGRYGAMLEAYSQAARCLGDEVRQLLLLQAGQG